MFARIEFLPDHFLIIILQVGQVEGDKPTDGGNTLAPDPTSHQGKKAEQEQGQGQEGEKKEQDQFGPDIVTKASVSEAPCVYCCAAACCKEAGQSVYLLFTVHFTVYTCCPRTVHIEVY